MEAQFPAHPESEVHPIYTEDLGKRKRMDTEQKDREFSAKAEEHEQSHTSMLLQQQLKLQQLERKLAYLQAEMDGIEARKRERNKVLAIFFCGAMYGIALYLIFSL